MNNMGKTQGGRKNQGKASYRRDSAGQGSGRPLSSTLETDAKLNAPAAATTPAAHAHDVGVAALQHY